MFEFSHGPPAFKTRWCISKVQEPIQRNQGGDYVRLAAPLKKAVLIFSAKPGAIARVSSERNVSRKNAKIFGRISHFFAKTKQNAKISRKCEYFVKTMSVITATINFSKELVEFSLL